MDEPKDQTKAAGVASDSTVWLERAAKECGFDLHWHSDGKLNITMGQLRSVVRMAIDDLKTKYDACHNELLDIHHIGMCIAECPPILDTDTMTVSMVKGMAIRLNKLPPKVDDCCRWSKDGWCTKHGTCEHEIPTQDDDGNNCGIGCGLAL